MAAINGWKGTLYRFSASCDAEPSMPQLRVAVPYEINPEETIDFVEVREALGSHRKRQTRLSGHSHPADDCSGDTGHKECHPQALLARA